VFWNYSRTALLILGASYVGSGIVIRIGGLLKRRMNGVPPVQPEGNPVG
jgi:hypothetical protein